MTAQTSLPGYGKAIGCAVSLARSHRPIPVRFVWHHIQPKEAGGPTAAYNLVQLCDNCHYTIHRLMWMMRQGTTILKPVNREQLRLAKTGFAYCEAAGTVGKIPNEG